MAERIPNRAHSGTNFLVADRMDFLCPSRNRSRLHAVRVVREQVDPHGRPTEGLD